MLCAPKSVFETEILEGLAPEAGPIDCDAPSKST
jgi:hypothetical protein